MVFPNQIKSVSSVEIRENQRKLIVYSSIQDIMRIIKIQKEQKRCANCHLKGNNNEFSAIVCQAKVFLIKTKKI
ncbi:hypothetical protein DERF_011462 [Dermatophagoides farinae]|uniref:Uncharacterized protein n=1 Tax=Dermatophagoides farinae TaxID=6954 RepID=A0A922HSZ6_DERFA|nr:hypothetical protein DERF_011462 [Dermatophagoides farinae]